MLTQKTQSNTIRRRIEVVVTGLTRNQLYRFRYRGFESHRLRHFKAVCLYTNKKDESEPLAFLFYFLATALTASRLDSPK